jgi:hypothetical protein
MLCIEGLQALPITHKFLVRPMHHINVPLQVCFADWGVFCRVQGRRGWWQLRSLASKAPEAPRLTWGPRVVYN